MPPHLFLLTDKTCHVTPMDKLTSRNFYNPGKGAPGTAGPELRKQEEGGQVGQLLVCVSLRASAAEKILDNANRTGGNILEKE